MSSKSRLAAGAAAAAAEVNAHTHTVVSAVSAPSHIEGGERRRCSPLLANTRVLAQNKANGSAARIANDVSLSVMLGVV